MSNEPSDAAKSPEAQPDALSNQPAENQTPNPQETADAETAAEAHRRRILIGSQRDPAAYLAKPRQARAPVVGPEEKAGRGRHRDQRSRHVGQGTKPEQAADARPPAEGQATAPPAEPAPSPTPPPSASSPGHSGAQPPAVPVVSSPEIRSEPPPVAAQEGAPASEPVAPPEAPEAKTPVPPVQATERVPLPNLREALPDDLEAELNAALADGSAEDLMTGGDTAATQGGLEPDSKHTGRVVAVRREDVFIELGSREQGIASLRQFAEPPEPGAAVEVIVRSLNGEDGFYELSIPGQAEDVADWSDLKEGMVVTARITGHNTGGLECEVNHIRGFIPVSQVSLYRVEGLEQFVGEQWPCLVTEANPDRRNLVLSRRALLEREREEARQRMFETLEPGQVYEGVVRKILDFGAFVELGDGVDGLLHISQLSWGRVEHPRDVVTEGQHIKVKIEKIDPETRKIGLTYRDLFESPWTDAEKKYHEHSTVQGKVTKLMEFGAFVELEPGVEGLVHISELSHKRVWRASDVVREGQEVEVLVLSVDSEAERISLSMKQLTQPEPVKKDDNEAQAAPEPDKPPKRQYPNQPLKGGLGRTAGGASFGLKW